MIPIKDEKTTWTDEQWEAIYQNGKNIIVSAGAGSGKTAVLTERIIEKIKSGISIDKMIILTFTNAAAYEMKDRIRKKLIENNLIDQLNLISQATITTFDSYNLSIVKKYHYLLGISKNINIIDKSLLEIQTRKILDEILKDFEDNSKYLEILDTYTIKDDSRIKEALLNIYSEISSIVDKENFFLKYMENYYSSNFIDDKIEEYLELIHNLSLNIINSFEILKNNITNPKLYEKFSNLDLQIENLNYCKDYDDYKKIDISIPSIRKSKEISEDDISDIKESKDILKKYVDEYKELIKYSDTIEIKEELLSLKDYSNTFIDILKKLDEKLFDYKLSVNSFTFSDIKRLSIKLLEENSDIKEEIKNNTNEIMIDEYQDTNDINDYFISLISNNNVYMVGDVKQSIYRFINANPKILMDKYSSYKNSDNGYAIDLNKNFRSRNEVLSNINLIFNNIMSLDIGGANYIKEHQMIFGNLKYSKEGNTDQNYNLEVYNYDVDKDNKSITKEEIEAFIIADDIIDKINNNYQIYNVKNNTFNSATYKDFVILVDRKSSFDLYKKIFDYKKIPITIHKEEKFIYSNEIYVIKNILKLINLFKENKLDEMDYPFISIARSYLFDFDDNEIFTSVTNKDYLKNDIFKELFNKINNLKNLMDKTNLSNLLKIIYKEFDMYSKSILIANVESTNKKLDYLIKLVSNLENIGYDLGDIISYFDEIYDKEMDIEFKDEIDINSNTVNIMTIHKSKGLEYPICYFPGLYKNFGNQEIKNRFLFNKKYGIILPINKEGLKDTIYKTLLTNYIKKEEISEKLRLFYVALTRSKEKMIMITPKIEIRNNIEPISTIEKLKYNSFTKVLESISGILKDYFKNIEYHVDKKYLKNIDYDISKIKKEEFKFSNKKLDIENKTSEIKSYSHTINKIEKIDNKEGIYIHEILEYLDFKNYKLDINNYNIDGYFKEKIFKLFTMPFMLNINDSKIYKEYEFYFNGVKGIIDLIIESNDKIIIVDYKLKDIDEKYYIDQIKGYIEYIKNVSNKKVEGYLYSILDSKYKAIL